MKHCIRSIEDTFYYYSDSVYSMYCSEATYPLFSIVYNGAYTRYEELQHIIWQTGNCVNPVDCLSSMQLHRMFTSEVNKYLVHGGVYQ